MKSTQADKAAILCVDDEPIILMALKQELRSAFGQKFDYETALDASQALELIDELREEGIEIILVISDWLMPGIKGDEFLVQARQRCPGTGTIMITGHADDESIRRLQEELPDVVVIRKPWNAARLRSAIEQCIERKGGCRER